MMEYSDLITRLPLADLPFSGADGYMLRSERGLAVFFHFKEETALPPHSHGAQWGTVLAGEIELTIGGVTRTYRPGESYSIRPGEVHSGHIPAGVRLLDVFEEKDRFQERLRK